MPCLVSLPKCTQETLYFELWPPPGPILCSKPLSGDAGQQLWAASHLSSMTIDGLNIASLPALSAEKEGPWKRRYSKCILHVQSLLPIMVDLRKETSLTVNQGARLSSFFFPRKASKFCKKTVSKSKLL